MVARTAKTAAAAPEVPEEVSNEENAPRVIKKGKRQIKRVPLFVYEDEDGNTTEFLVPEKPGPNVTLKFLDEIRRTGNEMFASMGLLEAMLGKEQYGRLLDIEDLEDEDLGAILEVVVSMAMERADEVAGK